MNGAVLHSLWIFIPAYSFAMLLCDSMTGYVAISNNLPKGKTKSTLKVSDQDGAAFACVDITLSNTADEEGEKAASHLR